MRLSDWLTSAQLELTQAHIDRDDAAYEPKRIAQEILGLSFTEVILRGGQSLTHEELEALNRVIVRRQAREPLSQILGTWEFWSLPFKVTPDTLTPRPDTEVLVEEVTAWLSSSPLAIDGAWVLDIGTGTGCIGLSLATELPHLCFELTDISERALAIAEENRVNLLNLGLLSPQAQVIVTCADLLERRLRATSPIAVVSNPPYIRPASAVRLMPEVIDYEPHLALFGEGRDGLGFVRRLALDALELLPSGGGLFVEVGYDQTDIGAECLTQLGYQEVRIRHDYGGQPRVICGVKP